MTALLLCSLLACADGRAVSAGLSLPDGFAADVVADSSLANDVHCMTVTPDGRLVVAGRNYLRILVPDKAGKIRETLPFARPLAEGANGLFWDEGDLWAVGDGGLRRYRGVDAGGIDRPSELVFACKTGGEHLAHAVGRGPDGWLYLLVGDQTRLDAKAVASATSPVSDPTGGVVLRFSPDLKRREVVAEGFRNAYAMDWNPDGELFTFDSDNERCASLPWYEPTRLYHVQSGGHHGWLGPRLAATWRRPPYFLDAVAPVATLGRGSPTGVVCYRHAHFPPRYRGGLFVLDWTFGVVHFVRLEKRGASYVGTPEVFARSVGDDGFAPTAAAVHPRTGELYVSIGGRGTRGAVYRIRHTGAKGIDPAEVAKLRPAPRSLEWREGLGEALVAGATGDDAHARRRALELIARHRPRFSLRQLTAAIGPSATSHDPALRRAAAGLLRSLPEKDRAEAGKGVGMFVGATTKGLAVPDWTVSDSVARAAKERTQTGLCLDGVRVLQLKSGDVGAASARGTVWEGYTRRDEGPAMPEATRRDLRRSFPSGLADLDREVSRTLALVEDDDAEVLRAVAAMLTKDSHPTEDVHYLLVLARLKAARTRAVTEAVADALIRLDAKVVARKMTRESNWDARLREAYAGLARRDPALHEAVVSHPDFGRPDHVLWARAAGFDRARAADVFLKKAKGGGFVWNAGLVALVGSLPAERSLPALRRLWGEAGLDDEILLVLARAAREEDFDKLSRGVASPRAELAAACLSAVEKLDVKRARQADEGRALLEALRSLSSDEQGQRSRRRLLARLTKVAGADLKDAEAALAWYAKAYPARAKALAEIDGVDAEAWRRRLAKVDWAAGDAARGAVVFVKASCATCHSGSAALGPDLAGAAKRFSRHDLFDAIVRPSKEVSPRYRTTQLVTDRGKTYSGIVVYDAADSVIVQTGAAETVRLDGAKVASRRLTASSLMPAGLLDRLSDAEVADLYAHLRSMGARP